MKRSEEGTNFLIYLIIAIVLIVLGVFIYYYIVNNSIKMNVTSVGHKVVNESGL
ncbi:MAG: hypothetical protein ACPLX8_01525 [Nanopusillaceae archaeon]